ncbi:MAG: phosphohistidine phosphatase SixA [Anaerolinea sp.]|nr:phosphohistidine phosphatase SixA [Anaerolinea sp.]
MELCLVRHAIAVERGTRGFEDDSLRPLTPDGARRFRAAGRGLVTLVTPQVIMTSPLLRARQTAEILMDVYGLAKLHFSDALASGDHAALLRDVVELEARSVMLVGHEPHMSGLLSYLLAGDETAVSSTFKKGSAALVSCQDEPAAGECWLEWLVQPAALRALGGR